jgi:hypothetical protein
MINFWIAANATNPGIPRKPETADVAKFIGTWIPKLFPAVFRKNNNIAPINNLTTAWPTNLAGLKGAPENKRISMSPPSTEMIIIGSKKAIPLQLFL